MRGRVTNATPAAPLKTCRAPACCAVPCRARPAAVIRRSQFGRFARYRAPSSHLQLGV